jgi:hypothetical protein
LCPRTIAQRSQDAAADATAQWKNAVAAARHLASSGYQCMFLMIAVANRPRLSGASVDSEQSKQAAPLTQLLFR